MSPRFLDTPVPLKTQGETTKVRKPWTRQIHALSAQTRPFSPPDRKPSSEKFVNAWQSQEARPVRKDYCLSKQRKKGNRPEQAQNRNPSRDPYARPDDVKENTSDPVVSRTPD